MEYGGGREAFPLGGGGAHVAITSGCHPSRVKRRRPCRWSRNGSAIDRSKTGRPYRPWPPPSSRGVESSAPPHERGRRPTRGTTAGTAAEAGGIPRGPAPGGAAAGAATASALFLRAHPHPRRRYFGVESVLTRPKDALFRTTHTTCARSLSPVGGILKPANTTLRALLKPSIIKLSVYSGTV